MDIYVMELDKLNSENLEEAKKITSKNRLLLLTDENGTMSCFLYPMLKALKVDPEFFPFTSTSPVLLAFFLGCQVADAEGNLFIITDVPDKYTDFKGTSFETNKGIISLYITDSISNALQLKKGAKSRASADNSTTNQSDFVNEPEDQPFMDADPEFDSEVPELEMEDEDLSENQEDSFDEEIQSEEPDSIPDDDETEYSPASAAFIAALNQIDSGNLLFKKYPEIIEEAIRQTPDTYIPALEMQLNMRLGEKNGELLYPIIEKHFDQLWEIAMQNCQEPM